MTKKLKKPIAFLTVFAMLLSMLMYFPAGTFGFDFGVRASAAGTITPSAPTNGDGSLGNPYQITSAAELYWFAGYVNGTVDGTRHVSACAKLNADITVNDDVLTKVDNISSTDYLVEWAPIYDFSGSFNGDGKTIKGLYINSTEDYQGMFGDYYSGSVTSLTLEDCYIKGGDYIGGIVARIHGLGGATVEGTIKDSRVIGENRVGGAIASVEEYSDDEKLFNMHNDNTTVEGVTAVGGVIGFMVEGELYNCTNSGSVTGTGTYIGGVFGQLGQDSGNSIHNVHDCTNSGTVKGYNYTGGIIGYQRNSGSNISYITDCVNSGTISSVDTENAFRIGGICGATADAQIYKCINTGNIIAENANRVGGICGEFGEHSIKTCYNTGDIKGVNNVGGISGLLYSKGIVAGCFSLGDVDGSAESNLNEGGLVGQISNTPYSNVMYSYFDSEVFTGNPIGNNSSLKGSKIVTADVTSGKLAYLMREGDQLAFWVQIVGTDPLPKWSDSLEYTVFPNKDGSGYHNHPGGTCSYDCALVPVQPTKVAGVYQIRTAAELYWLALFEPNFDAVLLNDIVVNSDMENPETEWTTIGGYYGYPYTGTFDGQAHTISGIYMDTLDESDKDIGLFGTVAEGATVKNVGLINSSITSGHIAGGICRTNYGTVIGCFSNSTVRAKYWAYAKGICYVTASTGKLTNSFYLEKTTWYWYDANSEYKLNNDTEEALPAEAFTSGELAYRLNNISNQAWGQLIEDTVTKDPLPVPRTELNTVYAGKRYHNHLNGEDPLRCELCEYPSEIPQTDENGVYQIRTLAELYGFAKIVNSGFEGDVEKNPAAQGVLTENILANTGLLDANGDLSATSPFKWIPIGTDTTPFTGSFDGQGHMIKGLYVGEVQSLDRAGLFDTIGAGGTVSNVAIDDCYFAGTASGGIAAVNNGTISGCYSYNLSKTTQSDITASGTVNNCFYLTGGNGAGEEMTAAQFSSGEVAYKLNGDQTTIVWGQFLKEGEKDPLPIAHAGKNRVYLAGTSNYHNHTSDYCYSCMEIVPVEVTPDEDGVYVISKASELLWFSQYVNSGATDENTKAELANDISVSINSKLVNGNLSSGTYALWTPIGTDEHRFNGTFDGKGYVVKGLYVGGEQQTLYAGLFGNIGENGTVKNVGVYNCYFTNVDYVGCIAAKNYGKISGCFTHKMYYSGTNIGNITADNQGSVENCFYLEGGKGTGEAMTEAQFTNGEVAYKLNGDRTTIVWGQLLTGDDANALPVPTNDTNRVFYAKALGYHNHTDAECEYCPKEPQKDGEIYQITKANELLWFAEYVNGGNTADAVLKNSIQFADNFEMIPIGTAEKPFNGSFEGKCCGISNLNINTTSDNAGLFGVIGTSGTVSNLAVTSSTINGSGNVGGIAGTNNGKISGCYTFGLTLTGAATTAGSGTADHSFSTSITILGAQKTAEQFKNGDVAYNLNADPANPVWGQLVNSAAEPLPVAVTAENQVFYAEEIGYHNHGTTDCPYCPVEPRTVDGVYQLSTANHLWWFAEFVNGGGSPADTVLLNNITISTNVDMIPIGTQAHPFNGSFNGNGHTISGLNFSDTNASNVGLFGYVSGGSITRLCITDSVFSGNTNVGAVCGYNGGANISECYVNCDITAAKYAGGICGYNSGTVKDCLHVGDVNSTNAGGIVGDNDGKVTSCINLGAAEGENCDNICGNSNASDVQNCYYNAELTSCKNSLGTKAFTIQLTAEDFLPGAATEWVKTRNDYTNHILYSPILKNVTMDDLEAEYTSAIVIKNTNTAPVKYGDDLNFSFDATTEINGNTAIVTDFIDPTALLAMDFVIEHNGEVLYNEFTLSRGSIDTKAVLWLITAGKTIGYIDISRLKPFVVITEDLEVGENTFRVTYNGTSVPWLTGASGFCTVTIVQAIPTVEEPTASAIGYGKKLSDSKLSLDGWSWVDSDIIPTVANNGYKVITNEPVDYLHYDYSNVEGYDPVTHLITRTIPVTVKPATPTIVVKPVPTAALPGKTVTVSAVVTNPNNNAMTDLPAVSFSYKIGDAAEIEITGNSFVIPKNTAIGTIIKVIARTSETANYFAGTNSANVIVTDCKHQTKTLQYNEISHWYHCDNCGADLDIEEHKGGTATCTEKAVCTVCEQAYGSVDSTNHVHVADVWSSDATGHWHECEDCHAQLDKAAHTSSGSATEDTAELCTICSYVITRASGRVATPAITPNGSTFSGSQKVTITCTTADATIYYTTNGDEPTANSKKYTGEFTITSTTTVKAIALKLGVDDSKVATAEFTKKSSGGGGGGGGGRPSTPTEPKNPALNDVEMPWSDIAIALAKLAIGFEATIQLNGNYTVPVEVIKAIAERDIKVTFVVDSVKSWKTDGAEITAPAAASLNFIKTASQKHDGLRGIEGIQFVINDTGIPTDLTVAFKAEHAGKFANLYKSENGKLVFVTCAKLSANGTVMLSDVTENGNYVAMLCEFSDLNGDMNNDGILNALDAAAILKEIVGLESGKNPLMADFIGDGKVNAFDASAILKRIVGLV